MLEIRHEAINITVHFLLQDLSPHSIADEN